MNAQMYMFQYKLPACKPPGSINIPFSTNNISGWISKYHSFIFAALCKTSSATV
jgi:hypothetical protein